MIRLTRPACPNPAALKTDYRNAQNKAALRQASSDKCMYCESKITATYFGDVEHIRPKTRFPELEFVWENHGFVCAKCNNAKRDRWHDTTPYVNPYEEDPEEHLAAFGAMVLHRHRSERGEITWRDVDLNRPELLEHRAERIKAIHALIDKLNRTQNGALRTALTNELQREVSGGTQYSLVGRAALTALR